MMSPAAKKQRKTSARPVIQPGPNDDLKASAPLVFISHDTRDADLAEAFGNLLTDASGGVLQSFRSSDRKGTAGIEFGAEWYAAIMSKLSDATDVVALLTAHSLERPWILYEAGVAKGKLDTTVLGLAVNIPLEQTNNGPFAQFQNCADDEDSLTKLVLQLIRRNPQAQPREEAVRRQVQAFQTTVKSVTDKRAKTSKSTPVMDDNAVAKMFEEVKILVRDLPERVGIQVHEASSSRRVLSRKRMHPVMLEEFMSSAGSSRRAEVTSAALTVIFSVFRNEIPWLYELGMEFTKAVKSGSLTRAESAYESLRIGFDMVTRGPFAYEAGLFAAHDKELMYSAERLVRSLPRFFPVPKQSRRGMDESSESSG